MVLLLPLRLFLLHAKTLYHRMLYHSALQDRFRKSNSHLHRTHWNLLKLISQISAPQSTCKKAAQLGHFPDVGASLRPDYL